MVPPAPAADAHADPAWLARINRILHLNAGGVIVGLEGAHPACAGPLIERLLEGEAQVSVCFGAHELLEAPEGARVVLLHAARDAEVLNLARPVVSERRLRVFVWLRPGDRRELSRRARDFLDWMQETIDVPDFLPRHALEALHRALEDGRSISWEGPPLKTLVPEVPALSPSSGEDEVLAAMQRGPVVIRNVHDADESRRFAALHRAAANRFGIIWEAPAVLPEHAERVIADPLDWEVAAGWLDDAGVEDPRVEAARLDLEPIAILRRAGREHPPMFAAGAERPSAIRRGTPSGPASLRVISPSSPVTLTAELDRLGQLVLRYQGSPLEFSTLHVIGDAASLPLKIEIHDFYARGRHWTTTAHHHDEDHQVHAWSRQEDRCSFDLGDTEGDVVVDVVASSDEGSRTQAGRLRIKVAIASGTQQL